MASPSVASRSRTPRRADPDDPMAQHAARFAEWARDNARLIVAATLVAAIAIAAIFYYRLDAARREQQAAVEFFKVQQTAASGNTSLVARDLNAFVARFSGTPEAAEARLLLARSYLDAGKAAQAVSVLQPFASRIGDSPLGPQGALLLATAQSEAGNRDAAIATYLRVGEQAALPYQKQNALSNAALLRQQAGNFAGAAELYRRAVDLTTEGSVQRQVFEMRRAEAEARARATTAGPAAPKP